MYIMMDVAPGKTAHNEAELLQNVLEVLHDTTGLPMTVEAEDLIDNAGHRADALVRPA